MGIEEQQAQRSALTRQVAYLATVCVIAVGYFAAAQLSLPLAIPPGYASPVWPPSGIAVAAVALAGIGIWPGIWLGAMLANLAVESAPLSATLIATGNTLEALIAATLIRRYAGNPGRFERGEDVARFMLVAAVSASVAATLALVPLAISHGLSLAVGFRNWWTWWQGDFAGIVLLTPLILSWTTRDERAWPPERKVEAAFFGTLLVFSAVALCSDGASTFVPFSLTFVALPFIIWAAFRFGQREVTTAIAVVCGVAIWYTVQRRELFASLALNELLLMLLGFISMVVATGLVLGALAQERRRTGDWPRERPAARRVGDRHGMENRLRAAIEREEFVLHYQPKVDLATRRIAGLEALLRWRSPELGVVGPIDFIPALEETGMILEVGRWAMARAIRDQALWAGEGITAPRVAVNVSAIQLRHRSFVESVRDAVAGQYLIDLEITESRIMEDIDSNIEKLKQLRALGVRIAIDDFGTGYSSLAYLAKLPVHTLKIDRTFIAGMLGHDDTMAVVQTVISLAQSLHLTTVAEGVETEEQADMLELLCCDQMQGYFISRPQPREAISALLR